MSPRKHLCKIVAVFSLFFGMFFSNSVCAATYSSSISTSGTLNLDVTSAGNGANITTDNVNIVSTCPAGYTVSIAATSSFNSSFNDTTLYKDGNKNNTQDTKKILSSTGTKDNPVPIIGSSGSTNYKKTWGYTAESNATINSNFIGLTNNQTILTTSSTGTSETGTTLPVYYGVSVDSTIEPGQYKMGDNAVITYYLTTSLDCTSYQVEFNPTAIVDDGQGGTTELSGTGTMNNQRIAEGQTTNLDANAFTPPSGYTFKEWNTKQDGTGTSYSDQQQVTDLTTIGQTITLYAQWSNCPAGNVCYDPNGASAEGTTASPTMSNQSIRSSATEINLWASNFKNPVKGNNNKMAGFAGWNTKADGTGTSYGPNETITDTNVVASAKSSGLKLYAMWVESAGDLQGWSGCGALNTGSVTALTDTRDNQTYAIAKLKDGNCWMIENLRLADKTSDNTPITISSTNTNSPVSTFTQLGASIDPTSTAWCTTSNAACFDQSILFSGNTVNPASNMTASNTSTPVYSYGNYYNWYSATAGNGTYSKSSGSTAGDICPTGWHLPTGTSSGEFYALNTAINSGATNTSLGLRKYPANFVYSGYVFDSSVGRSSSGRYWSSTAGDSNNAYHLYFYGSNVDPGTLRNRKNNGYMARCMVSGS